MAAAKKKRKEEAYPRKTGTSGGQVTNLKQSILETFDICGYIRSQIIFETGFVGQGGLNRDATMAR